ncbi:MAG: TrkA C-terminal domain-containing protein, partial [Ignavibacteria bacterium]
VPVILATFPLTAGLEIGPYIFNLVFFITLTSALVQGWSIPLAAKLFGVHGGKEEKTPVPMEMNDEIKTNNDLVELKIPDNSNVIGKSLAELRLPTESLITVIHRKFEYVVPSGSTVLEQSDTIVVLVNKDNIDIVKGIINKEKVVKAKK